MAPIVPISKPPIVPSLPSTARSTQSVTSDSAFDSWLAQKLKSERAAFVAELQENLSRHLESHRKALLAEVLTDLPHRHTHSTQLRPDSANLAPTASEPPAPPSVDLNPNIPVSDKTENTPQPTIEKSESKSSDKKNRTYQSKRIQELVKDFDVNEEEGTSRFEQVVESNQFEIASLLVILLNTVVLALQVQYDGLDSGYKITYQKFNRSAEEAWPGAKIFFKVSGFVFILIFILELVARLIVLKKRAFKNWWIWLDTILVTLGLMDLVWTTTSASKTMDATVFRMFRILKVVRMVKVVKKMKTFDSLLLLVKSLTASFTALLWSFLLLVVVQVAVGIALSQMLRGYINGNGDPEKQREVFEYFGTFTRSMVTMFESTVGNWIPPCRTLMENVSEAYGFFYIFYRCLFCFALVNVIRAVFITETSRVAMADDQIAMLKKERMQQAYGEKLRELFFELDDSGDGLITWQEFSQLLEDEVMKKYVSTLELDVGDLAELFKLLDDGDGAISAEEFCNGVARVKGPARSVDVVSVHNVVKKLEQKINTHFPANGVHHVPHHAVHPPHGGPLYPSGSR